MSGTSCQLACGRIHRCESVAILRKAWVGQMRTYKCTCDMLCAHNKDALHPRGDHHFAINAQYVTFLGSL